MIINLLILILSGLTMTAIGSLVYLRNPKSAMSRFFLLLCISIVLWLVSDHLVYSSTLIIIPLASRLAPAAAFNILFWLLRFSTCFGASSARKRLYRPGIVLFWLIGTLFSLSNLVYTSVSLNGDNVVKANTGIGYAPYLIMLIIMLGVSIWRLLTAKKQATLVEKTQINLMLWGAVTTFGIAIANNGIFPNIVENWRAVQLTPLLALFFVGTVSYAIVKHRLFDIRFVVARTVAYSLLVTILMTGYTLAVFAVTRGMFRDGVEESQALVYAGLAIFVAATFQPLRQSLERLTDKIFFRRHYASDVVLHDLTKIMATTLGIRSLTGKMLDLLLSQMRIARGAFFVQTTKGLVMPANQDLKISKNQTLELLNLLGDTNQLLIFDELPDGQIKHLMRQLNLNLASALVASGKVQGILVLGEKQSGEIYTDQDIKLLQILIPELAVAVDNSLNFEQISQFNQVLEHEVDQATKNLRTVNGQLARKNRQLEQLDRLKDEFISVTSHELRTPLTAIRGYLWMAMHGKNKDKNYDNYMQRAYEATERLISIVNDTLDISRIESGRVELAPTDTDMLKLAKDVAQELAPRQMERRQTLDVTEVADLPTAYCDDAKIRQVLVNLVGNALKFTPEGGKISVTFTSDVHKVTVLVSDTGPGIAEADQAKLFQKFSRLDASASIPGTGLGLYLCKQIVDLSGGEIWVKSHPGQGSVFGFSLPTRPVKVPTKAPANQELPAATNLPNVPTHA